MRHAGLILIMIATACAQDGNGKSQPAQPSVQTPSVQTTLPAGVSDDDIFRAVAAVHYYRDLLVRDPDSFVVEAVYLKPNKKKEPNICIQYRSRNGFGGMNKGFVAETAGGNERFVDLSEIGASRFGYCDLRKLIDVTAVVQARLSQKGN